MKALYLDFEFSQVSEKFVKVVSCATMDATTGETKRWWLHNSPLEQNIFKNYLKNYKLLKGYSCVAEARAMISLGLEPLNWLWYDEFLEYRCLTNHNDNLQWGEQLVEGKVKKVNKPRPKWERTEDEQLQGFSATHSLAEATFKLTGVRRDTEHKTKMRNLIISDPPKYTPEEREAILSYGVDDIKDLPLMYEKMLAEYLRLDRMFDLETYLPDAYDRGRYSVHTAHMESRGYAIDYDKTKNFSNQVDNILFDVQREICELFPEIKAFSWDRKNNRMKMNQSNIRVWIDKTHPKDNWVRTDGGDKSLSLEAFTRFYDFKHTYPKDNFGAQMVRLLKLKQNLFGFSSSKGGTRKNLWDSVGSDQRVRPYMNIYKAQSSRSQPASTSFMFLKPAWMRALVIEEPGYAMGGIDYSSQEFLISAIMAGDQDMINAYKSGDVYLAFAKDAGMVPPNGTKAEYKVERDACKATVLGISYLMTKVGLSVKLTADTGRKWDEDEAQEMINLFYNSYPELKDTQEAVTEKYNQQKFLQLPCVAEGSWIFTNSGIKKIEDVTGEDFVWDGQEFVRHGGVVQKGEKVVIHLNEINLSATPNHLLLIKNQWKTAIEAAQEGFEKYPPEKFLGDGRLSAPRKEYGVEGMSLAAAYVGLKNILELNPYFLGELQPVLNALNLCVPEGQSPKDTATLLLTGIFSENGKLATTMQNTDVKIQATSSTRGMVLGGFGFPSSALEISWNILLRSMGMRVGRGLLTELIMTETMSPETYELLASQLTTKTKVYDIINCGEGNRYQSGGGISHNCGWYMWGDNPNFRSVVNFLVQGFGASIMRKAVDLCHEKGVEYLFTLHDALYIRYKIGEEYKMELLRDAMKEAFAYYWDDTLVKHSDLIRLDPFAWSRDYKADDTIKLKTMDLPVSNLYIDERSLDDYMMFSKYFEPRAEDDL